MTVYYLDPLTYDDIAEDGEEREDGRKGRLAVDDKEGYVVDFEAIGKVAYTCATSVRMCDDSHLMSSIDEFLVLFSTVCG